MNLSSKGIYIILRICFKAWFLLNLVKDMRFANKILCHILYIQHNITLIIKAKAHLLLIVGNKIVTKKRRNRFAVGFMCKGNKSSLTIKAKLAKRRILFFFSPAYIICCQ